MPLAVIVWRVASFAQTHVVALALVFGLAVTVLWMLAVLAVVVGTRVGNRTGR
jgi:hypothetical protein